MGKLAGLFAGIGGRLTGAWSWISSAKYWLLVVLVVGLLAFLKGCDTGKKLQAASYIDAERKAHTLNDQSAGQAAGERETDTSTVGKAQAARDTAITGAADASKPSKASNALNCQRLRQRYTPAELKTNATYTAHCQG